MRAQRLSYESAGAAALPGTARPPAPRTPALARKSAGPAAPHRTSRSRAPTRQRRIVVVALLVAHGLAILGLMNAGRLRDDAAEAKPIFLAVIDTPAPAATPRPLPSPTTRVSPPSPLSLPPIATEAAPTPSPVVAPVPPPPALPADVAAVDTAPAPAPSLAPKTIPASAVEYLVPPAPVYSRVSARMRESGKAVVRVFIDEAGLPRHVQLAVSTGFARLDDAALAAVRDCRFKPYLENGLAVAGWAAIPIEFELPT